MKSLIAIIVLLSALPVWASQCRVDVKNEVHLDGQKVEIHRQDGSVAKLDENNHVLINDQSLSLNPQQRSMVDKFRTSMNDSVPKMKQVVDDSVEIANDVLDKVSASLNTPHAFDDVKKSIQSYASKMEQRYYKNGEFVLPANTYEEMQKQWTDEFNKMKSVFTSEFLTSSFNSISENMQQNGGMNLSKLSETMGNVKQQVTEQLKTHKKKINKDSKEMCESLNDIVQQEHALHEKIPELKHYQVFTI
ncbi:DUF2884 family protein [Vibrio palustris]|uniref:DUF2884 domain-containing protein n=1 Tax=Vibrio palustris TaxID=1918946 RepID=A0A1R4AZX7_9VIBR|nr:DUF2884 family protein [Vibrio palustris]SJL82218.1 hypothetical protein VPAL9027_00129 [Vibrio palustris]